ncbi:MAG TPA: tetraacyldisaccharide 4'-kinase [Candidatus Brocadiia bacterium]|nr:tetraacyldisaccharide 4'-kinase [Candidatus Brocadiia bacterium]
MSLIEGRRKGPAAALARGGLSALSLPYGAAIAGRNSMYESGILRSEKLPIPVVSVGNLTAGGTGKTPFVELIMRKLQAAGHKPGLLSRGYGRVGNVSGQPINDELLVLRDNLGDFPAYIGPDRAANGRLAVSRGDCDCLVMDDGFQHRRLRRDIDIVMIDATNPLGHGRLLPRGLLREPFESIRRARVVVLNRVDMADPSRVLEIEAAVRRTAAGCVLLKAGHQVIGFLRSSDAECFPTVNFSGKRVFAACGIGNPESFFRLLEMLGLEVVGKLAFPDHCAFEPGDIREIEETRKSCSAETVIVTQKDIVKIAAVVKESGSGLAGLEKWFTLLIRTELVSGEAELDGLLTELWPESRKG